MDHLRGKPLGLLVMQISGDVLDQGHLTLSQHSDLDWIRDRLFKRVGCHLRPTLTSEQLDVRFAKPGSVELTFLETHMR